MRDPIQYVSLTFTLKQAIAIRALVDQLEPTKVGGRIAR
jgi:hypothetical protein